ncbi:expressed unknown protein [Seminavis robusta]|uniref:Uncharacterized protein n=1 Tax=Seminavis robusta TaxID=568900 RepID=A0A9N8HW09_9STRA|nr:expressed unknown protein [Seminavis robusta]|eukprot:Sro2489_g329110.1 n/a (136) ;mRNA; r:6890-7297
MKLGIMNARRATVTSTSIRKSFSFDPASQSMALAELEAMGMDQPLNQAPSPDKPVTRKSDTKKGKKTAALPKRSSSNGAPSSNTDPAARSMDQCEVNYMSSEEMHDLTAFMQILEQQNKGTQKKRIRKSLKLPAV